MIAVASMGTLFAAGTGELIGAVIAVVAAVMIHAGQKFVDARNARQERRRERYADVVRYLTAWAEFAYRVRRRTDDKPETLTKLTELGHDLQERLACDEAWVMADDPVVAQAFLTARQAIGDLVGLAVSEAWTLAPITAAKDMNLGEWGPGPAVHTILEPLEKAIRKRTQERFFG